MTRTTLNTAALAIAAALAATVPMVADIGPARAEVGWSYDNLMTRYSAPDEFWRDHTTPYPSYMYSVIAPPRMAVRVYRPGEIQVYALAVSDRHVAYCSNRFRSYSAVTDSYLGYDGLFHRCVAPY